MNVLFLCTGNSCRSQMAEGFARGVAAGGHRVWSAGTNPQGIHPTTREVMSEVGVSLDGHTSKDLDEVPIHELDLVVTLCGDADRHCPAELDGIRRVHWDLDDPAKAAGTPDEVMEAFRATRDAIRRQVGDLMASA